MKWIREAFRIVPVLLLGAVVGVGMALAGFGVWALVGQQLAGLAVTNGPGLAGALIVGVNLAKSICLARDLPLTAVNHLEGHIYANWLTGAAATCPPSPWYA